MWGLLVNSQYVFDFQDLIRLYKGWCTIVNRQYRQTMWKTKATSVEMRNPSRRIQHSREHPAEMQQLALDWTMEYPH